MNNVLAVADVGERLLVVDPVELLAHRPGEVGREQIGGWYETEKIHARLKARAAEDPEQEVVIQSPRRRRSTPGAWPLPTGGSN